MPLTYQCPFHKYEQGLTVLCQAVTMQFATAAARRAFCYSVCAGTAGEWTHCPLYKQQYDGYEPGSDMNRARARKPSVCKGKNAGKEIPSPA